MILVEFDIGLMNVNVCLVIFPLGKNHGHIYKIMDCKGIWLKQMLFEKQKYEN